MNRDMDRLRQAYIDGELSASETAAFEARLTPEEKARLASEMQFEIALADRLREDAGCPEDAWRRTQGRLSQYRAPRRRWGRYALGLGTVAAAASLAFVLASYIPVWDEGPAVIVLEERTIDELAATSMIVADHDSAQGFLREHGFDLELVPVDTLGISRVHFGVQFLGARRATIAGSPVIELLYACCDYPEKVVVAEQGTRAAEVIGRSASGEGEVQATRTVGRYVAGVVGTHRAHGLLDVFSEEPVLTAYAL